MPPPDWLGWIYAAGGWTSRGGDDGREGEKRGDGSHTDAVARWNTLFGWEGDEESVRDQWAGFRLEAGAGLRPVRCLVAAERAQGASTRRAAARQATWTAERRGRAGYLII